jgi:hypothetical protein
MDRFDFLIDYNLRGQARQLCRTIQSEPWLLEMLPAPIHFIQFEEVGLLEDCRDFDLWQLAQKHHMSILTADRSAKDGNESLQYVIQQCCQPDSFPVVTVSNKERIKDKLYRERCAIRLVEICLEMENYLGVGRIYIP